MKFGRWTVLTTQPKKSLCRCECGTERLVINYDIQRGVSKSCGCLSRERTAEMAKRVNRTHGMDATPTYRSWVDMRRRCTQPHRKDYPQYGGRGITVCDRWMDSFANFFADMGERPKGKTLERRENNGPYEPDNCCWATKDDQSRNTRTNRFIEVRGERMTVSDAARKYSIPWPTMFSRLNRGWDPERCISEPARQIKPRSTKPDHPISQ